MSNQLIDRKGFPTSQVLTVAEAQAVVNLWKQNFPGVTVITSPSMGHPFLTIAHGFPGVTHMNVNGIQMKSPLFTNALASYEIAQESDGSIHYVCAYELMWPNVSSPYGESSNVSNYVRNLWKLGMEVHSDHYHWKSDMLHPAIHHMGIDMFPVDFTARTIVAIQKLIDETDSVLTTANARGTLSIPLSNGVVNANGNGNGVGIAVGKR